ncbi:ribosome-inactivating family protein [Streptomyces sp. NRRL F-2664]|uniref:ribosome-inactivating family protein n=1 Tax=Streptomyces sp. NRRL F-2664 TaxID=1463842 RepID=UPI0004C9BD42|nr:ribosome-inactivating family protein [Streptomyces sp. NRRL F-2664]
MQTAMLKPVSFSSAYASVDEYRLLMSAIRSRAADAHGVLSMAGRGEGGETHLPLRIQLLGLFIELYIELRPPAAGPRIIGFRNTFENGQAPPEAYVRHVRDAAAPPGVSRTQELPFGGRCPDLEAAAGVRRTGVLLGRRPLGDAVMRLHRNRDPKSTAHGMLVLSVMLCEAARFPSLADAMSRIWMTGGRLPDAGGAAKFPKRNPSTGVGAPKKERVPLRGLVPTPYDLRFPSRGSTEQERM